MSIHDGVLDARQGPATDPELIVELDLDPSIDVMLRRITPAEAVANGTARVVTGDEASFRRLVDAIAWVPAGDAPGVTITR